MGGKGAEWIVLEFDDCIWEQRDVSYCSVERWNMRDISRMTMGDIYKGRRDRRS